MARPTKLTKSRVKKLEDAFIIGATIEEACFNANISKQTYYNWTEENPELLDRFKLLRKSPVLRARKTLYEALDNNPMLAYKFLKNRLKKESERELNRDDNVKKININVINKHRPLESS
jgi:hypothetical protein